LSKQMVISMYPLQKREGKIPSLALTSRTWGIGGGTPAVTLRTWSWVAKHPQRTIQVHLYYTQGKVKMQLLF